MELTFRERYKFYMKRRPLLISRLFYVIAFLLIVVLIVQFNQPEMKQTAEQISTKTASFTGISVGDLVLTPDSQTKKWVAPSKLLIEMPFGGIATRSSSLSPEDLLQDSTTVVNFCHPHWHGIRQATYGQKYPVLEIPGITSDVHEKSLINFLSYMKDLKTIIVNGIPPNTINFARSLKAKLPKIEILFIYHGSLSQPFHDAEAGLVNDMIVATKDKVISRIGLVKNGLSESFAAFGVQTMEIWNFPEMSYRLREISSVISRKRWQIGVFGSSWVHKNIFVQVVALCAMKDVDLHVLKRPSIPYLVHCQANIVEHGAFLEHDQFMQLISRMDITLYVSLTECFPMTVVESISYGIPAITSATSAVYSLDPVLEDYLVVDELDSPDYIADKVERLRDHYEDITLRLWNLLPYMERKADRQLRLFVENATVPDITKMEYSIPARIKKDSILTRKPTVLLVTGRLFTGGLYYSSTEMITSALIRELLSEGHDVVLLADMPKSDVIEWKKIVNIRYGGKLTVYELRSMVTKDYKSPKPGSLERSLWIAVALRTIYMKTPFDIVEFADRGGDAYELLRGDYIPKSVMVVIRAFGTQQMYDQKNGQNTHDLSDESKILYIQERYSLITANAIFAHNVYQQKLLQLSYGIHPNMIHEAPIPLDIIASDIENIGRTSRSLGKNKSQVFLVDLSSQSEESAVRIVEACKTFLAENDVKFPLVRFVIVITELDSNNERVFAIADRLKERIPRNYLKYFEFHTKTIDFKTLALVSQNIFAVILGKPLEDSGYAGILMNLLRVPMILEDNELWREIFGFKRDVLFYSEATLSDAIGKMLSELAMQEKRKEQRKSHDNSLLDVYANYKVEPQVLNVELIQMLEKVVNKLELSYRESQLSSLTG